MKEQQCRITILPGEKELHALAGDSLYTLLLVAGIISAEDADSDRVCLERGSVSPAEDAAAEAAVFSAAELTEGWMLASQRRILGDAVISLYHKQELPAAAQVKDGPLADGYGMAFDIGAATITAGLVGLDSLRVPLMTACSNSQLNVAADLRDRLALASRDEANIIHLAALLRADLGMLAEKLSHYAGLQPRQIRAVTIAGSHAMLSLLRGRLPQAEDHFSHTEVCPAGALALPVFDPETKIYLLPAANRELGADAVAAALAADLPHKRDYDAVTLLVDFGANGEILAAGGGRILGCSVPALPFEGSGISAGMAPVTGAITDLYLDDLVTVRTVRDGRPCGICGAGLISAAATLFTHGMLDADGRLTQPEGLPEAVASRLRHTAAGREFILSPADKHFPRDICINQEDLLQLQMAKASIFAACQAVLSALGAGPGDVREALLAESYRANIRPAAVLRLGMLPAIPQQQVLSIGNASWQGAYLALSSRRILHELEQLAKQIERLDLNADQVYAEAFLQAMNFDAPA